MASQDGNTRMNSVHRGIGPDTWSPCNPFRLLATLGMLGLAHALGGCSPAPRKSTHYLSIRNDAKQDVYVTYSGGIRSVSVIVAPDSRVIMRGDAFRAHIYPRKEERRDYHWPYMYERDQPLAVVSSIDAKLLPSGDQVRIHEDGNSLRADEIGANHFEDATK